jgi:hypothetical protein
VNAKGAKGSKRGDWYAEVAEGAEDAEKRGWGRGGGRPAKADL